MCTVTWRSARRGDLRGITTRSSCYQGRVGMRVRVRGWGGEGVHLQQGVGQRGGFIPGLLQQGRRRAEVKALPLIQAARGTLCSCCNPGHAGGGARGTAPPLGTIPHLILSI